MPPTVFISYNHNRDDKRWKDHLVRQLGVLEHEGLVEVWHDGRIQSGVDWLPAIESAMAQARVAIFIVSSHFLNSEFIRRKEIPTLMDRRRTEGLRIIPVIARPCPWQRIAWLAAIQARPAGGKTLAELGGVRAEKVLSDLAQEVLPLLEAAASSAPGGLPTRGAPPYSEEVSVGQEVPVLPAGAPANERLSRIATYGQLRAQPRHPSDAPPPSTTENHRSPALRLVDDDRQLVLVVPEQLRDKAWAECFGEIQQALARPDGRELALDLRYTRWADPTPLLALALVVEEWRQAESPIVIALADPSAVIDHDADPGALEELHRAKFPIFLERDGFLAALAGMATGVERATAGLATAIPPGTTIRLGTGTVSDLTDLRQRLYTGSPALTIPVAPAVRANLFDLRQKKYDSISDLADALIAEAESSGLRRQFDQDVYSHMTTSATAFGAPDLSSEVLAQELRQIFIELLENVKEHAYENRDAPHLAAVYARFRPGLQDPRAAHLRSDLIRLQRAEEKHCPRIGSPAEAEQTGFIEIFIADAGIGLATHLARTLKRQHHRGDRKHPLKTFFEMLARGKGFSVYGNPAQRKQTGKSPLPGLQHVTFLLGRSRGLFRALDKREWAGARWPPSLPEPGSYKSWNSQFSESVSSDQPVGGTYILIRASIGDPRALAVPWAPAVLPAEATVARDAVLAAWTDNLSAFQSWRHVSFAVIDEEQRRWRAEGLQQLNLDVGGAGEPCNCVLWRPARDLRRNDIRLKLQEIGSASEHVIIADQDVATALMTAWTLQYMTLTGATRLRRVSIVSNNLVAVDLLARQQGGRGERRLATKASSLLFNLPGADLSLAHVVAALRHLDGSLFWAAVGQNNERFQLLLPGPIHWTGTSPGDEDFRFEVYLDFSQILHVKLCRWVCRRALSRFLSYCSPTEAPVSIDHLIDPLVYSLLYSNNTEYGSGTPGARPAVLLGSILMSWDSLSRRRRLAEVGERLKNPLIAYLLQHPRTREPSQRGELALSLIPWSDGEVPKAQGPLLRGPELRRITDTPIVSREGTRYWRAYRRQGATSLYGGSPDRPEGISISETYGFWQSRGLLRLGHWHLGSSHHFIGVDLLSAIRISRVEPRSLVWTFLRGHLQRLSDGYQERAGFQRCHLLVCVPNEGTNLIVSRAVEEMDWLEARTIYLPLVQRQHSAMQLRVSPVALDAARRRVRTERASLGHQVRVRVLLLDLLFEDARTLIELVNIVKESGADEVETLALLDRTRLPTDINSYRRGWHLRHARLWRLDVGSLAPSSGPSRAAGCPLCAAIEELASTMDEVPERNETARQRLAAWAEILRVQTLAMASPLVGLPAVTLAHPINVGFGHDIDSPEQGDGVQILGAAALSSILLEAVSITGDHESVPRTLNELKPAQAPGDGRGARPGGSWHLAARLYVLIGQALLMRHDSELDRRVTIYRSLLEALFDCDKTEPASAFGALVLATAGDTIVRTLVPDIEARLRMSSPNFDLALALAMMARRYDELRRLPQVEVFLCLLGRRRDDAPSTLREIFLIVGWRDGAAHCSVLHRLLTTQTGSVAEEVLSLVESVIVNLRHLQSLDAWLPRNQVKEWIDAWIRWLAEAAQALWGITIEGVGRSLRQLHQVLYGDGAAGGSVFRQLQDIFSLNVGQVERLLDGLPAAARALLEREGMRNFSPETVKRVRGLYLLPIEQCVHEFFDNAIKHLRSATVGESGADGKVRWSCSVDGEAIVLEIRNPCDAQATSGGPSQSQGILEYLGGRVTVEMRREGQQAELASRIRLPTLLDLVRSLGT